MKCLDLLYIIVVLVKIQVKEAANTLKRWGMRLFVQRATQLHMFMYYSMKVMVKNCVKINVPKYLIVAIVAEMIADVLIVGRVMHVKIA